MPIVRLTDSQREEAGTRLDQAKRMARRFRPPSGLSAEEWQSEVFLVLVETVANIQPQVNFEALFYMRCRWRKLSILEKQRRRPVALAIDPVWQPQERNSLEDVLHGVSAKDSDIIRLRLAGGRWLTIGMLYGVSGRTIQRWHDSALGRIRRRVSNSSC